MQPEKPVLSIVVTSTHGWPEIEPCLLALGDQVLDVGGEIVVTDSSGCDLPADFKSRFPAVRWIVLRGEPVFVLRGEAIRSSCGTIIASTEDHCVQAPDWCERILQAHSKYPDALAIAGAVENGSTQNLLDWANYFIAFCGNAPPVRSQSRKAVPIANVSYKCEVFDGVSDFSPGWLDFQVNARIREQGLSRFDEKILVTHYHSHGLVGNLLGNYHNGRSTTGLAAPDVVRKGRLQRLMKSVRKLWSIPRETFALMAGKPKYKRTMLLSSPFIVLLGSAHVWGEIMGVLRGPGHSPYLVD